MVDNEADSGARNVDGEGRVGDSEAHNTDGEGRVADGEGRVVGEGRQLRDIRLRGGEGSAVCAVCRRSVALTKAEKMASTARFQHRGSPDVQRSAIYLSSVSDLWP